MEAFSSTWQYMNVVCAGTGLVDFAALECTQQGHFELAEGLLHGKTEHTNLLALALVRGVKNCHHGLLDQCTSYIGDRLQLCC
eukprot:4690594-Amphidinium_carterae.2